MPRKPKKPATFASAAWTVSDVRTAIENMPDNEKPKWTDEQCEDFLDRNEKYIVDGMVQCGWDIIGQFLLDDVREERKKK